MTIHRAERADVLADGLAGLLAEPPEDPFERDLVVVAANGVERWLAQTLSHRLGAAPGSDAGICAGIELVRPMHLLSEQMVAKQAEAYDRGHEAGMQAVAADGIDISGQLNQGMAQENSRMAEQLRNTKTGLMALQGRDDLSLGAKEQVAGLIAALE